MPLIICMFSYFSLWLIRWDLLALSNYFDIVVETFNIILNRPYALTSRLHNNDAMLGVKACRAARTCFAGRAHWRSPSQSVCAPGPARRCGMQGFALWLHAWRWCTWRASFDPQHHGGALLWRHMHMVYNKTAQFSFISYVFYCFVNFLCISLFLRLMYFIVDLYGIVWVLNITKYNSDFNCNESKYCILELKMEFWHKKPFSIRFVHKSRKLSNFEPTFDYIMLRNWRTVRPIFLKLRQKLRKTSKKKVMKACGAGKNFRETSRGGGFRPPPPPPGPFRVKLESTESVITKWKLTQWCFLPSCQTIRQQKLKPVCAIAVTFLLAVADLGWCSLCISQMFLCTRRFFVLFFFWGGGLHYQSNRKSGRKLHGFNEIVQNLISEDKLCCTWNYKAHKKNLSSLKKMYYWWACTYLQALSWRWTLLLVLCLYPEPERLPLCLPFLLPDPCSSAQANLALDSSSKLGLRSGGWYGKFARMLGSAKSSWSRKNMDACRNAISADADISPLHAELEFAAAEVVGVRRGFWGRNGRGGTRWCRVARTQRRGWRRGSGRLTASCDRRPRTESAPWLGRRWGKGGTWCLSVPDLPQSLCVVWTGCW